MRVFAIHNAAGAISEIITAPDDGPAAGIVTRAGWSMTEVEVPAGFQIADGAEGNVQKWAELVLQYRVICEPRRAKLKRHGESGS